MKVYKLKNSIICLTIMILICSLSTVKVFASSTVTRLAGIDRYETSAAICENGWNQSNYAILVNGKDFPDALCAVPLAKKYDAPILLTSSNTLNNATQMELTRLGVKKVLIVGGTASIPEKLENLINSMNIKTVRFAGKDRFETSVKVAREVGLNNNGIVIANGNDFPDILSVSAIAAQKGMPIILVSQNYISNEVLSYINENSIQKVYVLGNSDLVGDNLVGYLPKYERLSGSDRYSTNINIINRFVGSSSINNIIVASGESFPDALSGTALAAKLNAPIVLTNGKDIGDLKDYTISKNSNNIILLGGNVSISPNVEYSFKLPKNIPSGSQDYINKLIDYCNKLNDLGNTEFPNMDMDANDLKSKSQDAIFDEYNTKIDESIKVLTTVKQSIDSYKNQVSALQSPKGLECLKTDYINNVYQINQLFSEEIDMLSKLHDIINLAKSELDTKDISKLMQTLDELKKLESSSNSIDFYNKFIILDTSMDNLVNELNLIKNRINYVKPV